MPAPTNIQPVSSKARNVALWALQIVTAAAFLMAGFGSLSGYPMMVETFDKIGIGQWFRYITGLIEVAAAVLLLIPRFTPIGAALLICTMSGAVLSHLLLIGGSPVPALVLLCFATIILWGRYGVRNLKYAHAGNWSYLVFRKNGSLFSTGTAALLEDRIREADCRVREYLRSLTTT